MIENKKNNTFAVVGFILSITTGILGLIISIIALLKIKKTGEDGKEFAIAGIIIGIITTIIILLLLMFIIFKTSVWPNIKDELVDNKDELINTVYCAHAFNCIEVNGQMECFYCENGSEYCDYPEPITCPIE